MPEKQSGEYYYGSKADQYTFYRLPKVLFTDARYKPLSDGAKILYGLMLDRMLKLDHSHIEYVMDSMDKATTEIRDIRSYLLTALHRSPATISNKCKVEVNHDIYAAQPPK